MTQLPLMHINRHLLLLASLEHINQITEKDKTHPIVHFILPNQQLQIVLNYCIQKHYLGDLLLCVLDVLDQMRIV